MIDVEFVRAARAQRSAARARDDDDAGAKTDEKLPYLALEDSTEHDVLDVLRQMGALSIVGMRGKKKGGELGVGGGGERSAAREVKPAQKLTRKFLIWPLRTRPNM